MATVEQASLSQRWNEFRSLDHLTNHWYWRPGWHTGRRFYTWHLTFAGQQDLYDLSATVQHAIEAPYLTPVPDPWLHLTMQGLGFADEVDPNELNAIVRAAHTECASVPPFDITLGPVDPDSQGIGLLIQPWQPVIDVRDAIRRAIGTVWTDVPESPNDFRPHVTLAYSADDAPTQPLIDQLTPLRSIPPAPAHIDTVELIRLGRDEHLYKWDIVATVPLGR
jgi:2'-5' RNA ligase